MNRLVAVGECMLELSAAGSEDLWRMGIAGDTLNTLWYARAVLGPGWLVDYATRLGIDPFSERIMAFLEANGIGTAHIGRDATRGPGLYAITLSGGERSFTYWRGQSAARHLADETAPLAAAFAGAAVVYLSGITLAILPPEGRARLRETLGAARRGGAKIVFDTNYRPRLWESRGVAQAEVGALMPLCDIVLPSADDEAALFGDADAQATARRWRNAGAPEGAVKNGGRAIHWWAPEGEGLVELPAVAPVDSTAAGDSFNGAYLAARLSGADPARAIAQAHRLASAVIGRPGALIPMDMASAAYATPASHAEP